MFQPGLLLRYGKNSSFTFEELNEAIREKLQKYNSSNFQKKDGSRQAFFEEEEASFLIPLPASPYELTEWKEATVQYNYHVSYDNMFYSVTAVYFGIV